MEEGVPSRAICAAPTHGGTLCGALPVARPLCGGDEPPQPVRGGHISRPISFIPCNSEGLVRPITPYSAGNAKANTQASVPSSPAHPCVHLTETQPRHPDPQTDTLYDKVYWPLMRSHESVQTQQSAGRLDVFLACQTRSSSPARQPATWRPYHAFQPQGPISALQDANAHPLLIHPLCPHTREANAASGLQSACVGIELTHRKATGSRGVDSDL